jgi:hypothetical protein
VYQVKRATTPGGPYTTIATPSITTFVDTGRAIGPTYYYVVTAYAACGESSPSNEASATPFGSKTGTFPPGLGPCKPPAAAAAATAPATLATLYGSAAMPDPSSIPGTTGVGPKQANTLRARSAAPAHYSARVRFEMRKDGTQTVIAPKFAAQIEGTIVPNPALIDRILVVAKADGSANFVATVPDPRVRRTLPNPNSSMPGTVVTAEGGMLSVDLPEMFLSPDLVSRTVFEFYAMSNSVPSNTPVSVAALPALMNGASPLATSNGTTLSAILFATQP